LHTLGMFVLALQVQDGAAPVSSGSRVLIDIITKATVINQAVLAILIVISVASWAIILSKSLSYRRVQSHTEKFLQAFRSSSKFSEVQAVCATLPASPLVGVFQAGYAELNAQLRQANPAPANPAPARPTIKSLAALDRALLRAAAVEVNKLEGRLQFLATTASITPYIGLFGTVLGIIHAFADLAQQGAGQASKTVMAGISEALVSTAIGLVVALPAVVAFNWFQRAIKTRAAAAESLSGLLLAHLKREHKSVSLRKAA